MMRRNRYPIRHINLRNLADKTLSFAETEGEYHVYWWGHIPLGHRWTGENAPPAQPSVLLWESIRETLQFYASKNHGIPFEQPASHWHEKKWECFTRDMGILLGAYQKTDTATVPDVSLVICTRNRTHQLKKCLDALAGLWVPPKEVIVVDNAPDDDRTKQLVAGYPAVTYVPEPAAGLDRARNTGWQHATSAVVAYTDDDVELHPDWTWQLAAAFDDPRVQAVTGLVFAAALDTAAQVLFEKYWSFNRGYADIRYDTGYFNRQLEKGVTAWEIGAGANMAFRRSALRAAGGFDPRLDAGAAGCNGDSEMWYRLMAEGWTIHYTPRAIAYHTHRREEKAFKKQIHSYLSGAAAAILVQHQRYGHRGDLLYLYRTLPLHYVRSFFLKLRYPFSDRYTTLLQEITGYLAGIRYFYSHRQPEPLPAAVVPPGRTPDQDTGSRPLVSVIITTYNHARYLPDAIDSVLRQTYGHVEMLVVDDGSTDHTAEIMTACPGINYIRQPHQGLSAARNTGIFNCTGDFVVFLDADDLLYPCAIEKNLAYFRQHPACAFVSGWHDRVDEHKKLIETFENQSPGRDHYHALLQGNYIGMHGAVTYRRGVFNAFLFDETLSCCEDYDLYLRIAGKYPVFSHDEKLAAYRIHNGNMSRDIPRMLRHVNKVLAKNTRHADREIRQLRRRGKKNWRAYYGRELYRRIAYPWLYPGHKSAFGHYWLAGTTLPWQLAKTCLCKGLNHGRSFYLRKTAPMKTPIKRLTGKGAGTAVPRTGKVRLGNLRRTMPLSKSFGYDRGGPVDRYYIENFLEENAGYVTGNVLEIGSNDYTLRYGGDRVRKADVLDIDPANPAATIIGDLSHADHIKGDQFDCIILTQTLQLIYDFQAALRHCHRLLKPGGALLLTVPGISQTDYGRHDGTWYWSFRGASVQKLLQTAFNPVNIRVQTHGNVLAATAFLYGMGTGEITDKEKDDHDPHYEVIIAASALKA
jgi:glycosyltransferase involved in cell wall biosynthesis